MLLGLEAPEEELVAAFALAAQSPAVKGFAIGRTIFAAAAEKWLAGSMPDEEAVAEMAARFEGCARRGTGRRQMRRGLHERLANTLSRWGERRTGPEAERARGCRR